MSGTAHTLILILSALLGTGVLCIGSYLVYRHLNLQCRQLTDWFQRNTVRVGYGDVESRAWGREARYQRDGYGGNEYSGDMARGMRSAMKTRPAMPERMPDYGTRDTARLRGGHGSLERGSALSWENERQILPYVPKPVRAYTRTATCPQALGWHQQVATYDHAWQAPAVFQQPVPGAYYAYVTPGPEERPCGRCSLGVLGGFKGRAGRLGPWSLGGGGGSRGGRYSERILPRSKSWFKPEPTGFEGDCVGVCDEHQSFSEKAKREQDDEKRDERMSEHTSSTDLGTISSSHSSIREEVCSGVPLDLHSTAQNCPRCSDQARGAVHVQFQESPYMQRPQRGRRRPEFRANDEAFLKSRRGHSGRVRQASGDGKIHMRGGGTDSDPFPEGRRTMNGSTQNCSSSQYAYDVDSTHGKRGFIEFPDHSGRPVGPASPKISEVYRRRVDVGAESGYSHAVLKHVFLGTAVLRGSQPKAEPACSDTMIRAQSGFQVATTPVDNATAVKCDTEATTDAEGDDGASISTEASFYMDQRR